MDGRLLDKGNIEKFFTARSKELTRLFKRFDAANERGDWELSYVYAQEILKSKDKQFGDLVYILKERHKYEKQ